MLIPACRKTLVVTGLALSLLACSGDAPQSKLEVAVDGLYGAAFSQDGQHALIGAVSHGGSWWQIQPGERLFDWNHDPNSFTNITAAAISPDGKFAMSADAQTMALWDTQTGADITYWKAPAEILDIAITNNTNDGVLAALALDNFTAVIFNATRGRIVAEFNHENRVRSVAISPDGEWLLSGSEDRSAIYWSVVERKEISRYQHNDEVRLVELSHDKQLALSVSKYDKAMVWRTADGSEVAEVPILSDALRRGRTFASAAFSPDDKQLATGSSDRIVQLWQIADMKEIGRWEMPKRSAWKPTGAAVLAVGFNNSNGVVAAASNGYINTMQP